MSDLTARAHAFLFFEGGSLSRKKLVSLLGCTEGELDDVLNALKAHLEGSGVTLIRTETEAGLAIAPSASKAVQKAFERELGREIGDAGLEVLAIVLYRGPSTRAQIDYVRGVNTSSTLRNLLSRGLLERTGNPEDAREYLYRPTVELLAHLGITENKELPDYATIVAELAAFEAKNEQSTDTNNGNTSDTTHDADRDPAL